MNWEEWVSNGEACHEVILECSYSSFRGIGTMEVRGNKFEVDRLLPEIRFKFLGAPIVEDLDLGNKLARGEIVVSYCLRTDNFVL